MHQALLLFFPVCYPETECVAAGGICRTECPSGAKSISGCEGINCKCCIFTKLGDELRFIMFMFKERVGSALAA